MSKVQRPVQGPGFEYVRSAASDTMGRVTLFQRRYDVALGGFYEFPGSRVARQNSVLRPLVMEREICNNFGLVVRSAAGIEPIEYGVGAGGQFLRSFTYRARILGGDPVDDTDMYQRRIQIEPEEALKFSEFLTPECCRIMGMLVVRPKGLEQSETVLQEAA